MFKKKLVLKIFLFIVVTCSFLWAAGIIYCTIGINQTFGSLRESIDVQDVQDIDLDKVGARLPEFQLYIKGLEVLTRPIKPIFSLAGFFPGFGASISQIDPLIVYSSNLVEAGSLIFSVFDPIIELSYSDPTGGELIGSAYQVLEENQDALRKVAESLEDADRVRGEIDPSWLPDDLSALFYLLDDNFEALLTASRLLPVLPDLLGTPEDPQTYLLQAQNRDELRATGGFVSGIGLLTVAGGEIQSLEIGDSYLVDDFSKNYPPPPEPMQKFMLAGSWLPRDANWSPDFPTAARHIQDLYTLSTGNTTDGVIAFDQDAVIQLVGIIEPLVVNNFPEPITSANVELAMQQAWGPGDGGLNQEWWQHRKDFMPLLMGGIFDHLLDSRDPEIFLEIGTNLLTLIKSGHVLIYLSNDLAQNSLSQVSLDNSIQTRSGDYLYLVDSNLGFNKTDAVVNRSLSYFIDLSDPQNITAMLIVRYRHTIQKEVPCKHESSYGSGVYHDMQIRCYWDYWRVYTHPGTILKTSNQTPVPGQWLLTGEDWSGDAAVGIGEGNTQVVSGFFVLPTGSTQDLSLQFVLPPNLLITQNKNELVYSLRLQKQAGLSKLPVVIQIKPPDGTHPEDPPLEWVLEENSGFWIWTGEITMDRDFKLVFSP